MDHESNARVTRRALAAALLLPALLLPTACSSASSGGGPRPSAFAPAGPSPSGENADEGSSSGYGSSSGAVDSGTLPALGGDSGAAPAVDAGTSSTDATAAPVDSAPPSASFAGTFSCNLTFNYNLNSPISDSGAEMATGVLTTTESGMVVSADFGGDAGISCTLTFADDGEGMSALSPASSQTCDVMAMGVAVQVSFTSGGSADLTLPMLSATIPFQLSDGPGGSLGIQGSGSLSAACTKM
jgi:hypothetical protein